MSLNSKELFALLEEQGCYFLRQGKGSHQIWYSPITQKHFPIPAPKKDYPAGTLRKILKDAGVSLKNK